MFCSVVAIFDVVHDVDGGYVLQTTSGNIFWNMSDARETARFPHAISRYHMSCIASTSYTRSNKETTEQKQKKIKNSRKK